jgi:hypothetical protein
VVIREAVRDMLAADAGVAAITGPRVYVRRGPYGGISNDETPEAFTADGDLRPSLVVVEEVRTRAQDVSGGSPTEIYGAQVVAVYAYQHEGYDHIDALIKACKRLLNNRRGVPIAPDIWIDSDWSSDGPDQVDPALGRPVRVVRFTVLLREEVAT